eukprot:7438541-Alexandrium_andersonii.AAC.1
MRRRPGVSSGSCGAMGLRGPSPDACNDRRSRAEDLVRVTVGSGPRRGNLGLGPLRAQRAT